MKWTALVKKQLTKSTTPLLTSSFILPWHHFVSFLLPWYHFVSFLLPWYHFVSFLPPWYHFVPLSICLVKACIFQCCRLSFNSVVGYMHIKFSISTLNIYILFK
uniref:Uncharacterized protein n=1 Tax=Cacopsylla melanoneura TaxID=428564 RepID=A0A8D9BXK7_9HEMI